MFLAKISIYAVAITAAVILFVRRSGLAGPSAEQALPIASASAVGMIVGGRLYSLLLAGGVSIERPSAWVGGHAVGSWGALLGAALASVVYMRHRRIHPLPLLDAGASVAGMLLAAARLGCLLAGCDFGRVTSVPWAMTYPAGSDAFRAHIAAGMLKPGAVESLPIHPLPIYLCLNALALFLILSFVWRRTRDRPGTTFAVALVLYGTTRFFWEFLRDPAAGGAVTGISLSQKMALVSIGMGAAIAVAVARRVLHRGPTAPTAAAV